MNTLWQRAIRFLPGRHSGHQPCSGSEFASARLFSRVKFAYFSLNTPTPCPPRSAVPVNHGKPCCNARADFRQELGKECDSIHAIRKAGTNLSHEQSKFMDTLVECGSCSIIKEIVWVRVIHSLRKSMTTVSFSLSGGSGLRELWLNGSPSYALDVLMTTV